MAQERLPGRPAGQLRDLGLDVGRRSASQAAYRAARPRARTRGDGGAEDWSGRGRRRGRRPVPWATSSTGSRGCRSRAPATAAVAASMSVRLVATISTRTASTSPDSRTASTMAAEVVGGHSGAGVHGVGRSRRCPGHARRSSSGSSSDSSGTTRPQAVAASAASTPIPPALLTMPDARAGGERFTGQQERGLGQVLGAVARDHAGLGEQGGDADRGSGGGRRVRGAGAAAPVRPAADHSEQRLALGEATGDAGELRRVAEGLEVERGRGDSRVVGPRGEQVVAGHVDLVAEGDQASRCRARAHAPGRPARCRPRRTASPRPGRRRAVAPG